MSAYNESDIVQSLSTPLNQLVTTEDMLDFAEGAGLELSMADWAKLRNYTKGIVAFVASRMELNAKMSFLAAYGYGTYSFDGGYAIADPSDDPDGYFIKGDNLVETVYDAYAWLTSILTP